MLSYLTMCLPAFMGMLLSAGADAAGTSLDLAGLMTSSVGSIQTQLFTVLNIVIPAIVSILAVVICVNFGMNWLKKIGKK